MISVSSQLKKKNVQNKICGTLSVHIIQTVLQVSILPSNLEILKKRALKIIFTALKGWMILIMHKALFYSERVKEFSAFLDF